MIKNLQTKIFSKTVLAMVLPLLCMAAAVPAWAQSAEIRAAGVYYIDIGPGVGYVPANVTGNSSSSTTAKYCGWPAQQVTEAEKKSTLANKSAITNVADMNTNDPWMTSALIEYDQPYPSLNDKNTYPNHCLSLCFDVYCTNKPNGATTYSITFPLQKARFEIAQYNNSKDIMNPDTSPAVRTIDMSILDNYVLNADNNSDYATVTGTDLSDYMCAGYACYGSASNFTDTQTCPNPEYECMLRSEVLAQGLATGSCANPHKMTAKTWTDKVFDWVFNTDSKVVVSANPQYCCRPLNSTDPHFEYVKAEEPSTWLDWAKTRGYVPGGLIDNLPYDSSTTIEKFIDCGFATNCSKGEFGTDDPCEQVGYAANGRETTCIVRASTGKGYNDPIRFCTGWDGSREIQGEFGKINGQFGFRANVQTKYNGDGIAVQNIEVDDTFVYPSKNQYPIQVDVTNVHTVRTTPTVMGAITSVEATPYTIAYRLSKDANVKMQILEPSASTTTTPGSCSNVIPSIPNQSTCSSGPNGTWANVCGTYICCAPGAWNASDTTYCGGSESFRLVRDLIDWQPRLGEGFLGSDKDTPIVESEVWDGRDDSGRLLPANNYLVTIQATSTDEWGSDLSRQVTRQLSLDPLKLTDIVTTPLSKQSTAYATIKYVATQTSNVYFAVYPPGTTFTSLETDGSVATGTPPSTSNNWIYKSMQERSRGAIYTDKWDGLCHREGGCTLPYPAGTVNPLTGVTVSSLTNVTFEEGAPMPDGDYVYVVWAEIPYNDTYTASGKTYKAVKTVRYYTGPLSVERGLVDITIQPVSYSTIGSSPTAYGLDPFIFKYSVAREALVDAYVKNTAGTIVKTLTNANGNTAVARQMNTLAWDGLDDNGRMVAPATYLFVVEAADPMFPNSVKSFASAQFPVDIYRVTDVSTTDVYGDSGAKATISYMLSKAMNVQINIYNKDVVIPAQSDSNDWPPRVCNTTDDSDVFTSGHVDPNKIRTTGKGCIYVNDTSFTNYPSRANANYNYAQGNSYNDPVAQTLDVRLQPIKTFNRSALRTGDGLKLTEEWDAQYFYNPTSTKGTCTNNRDITTCPYEMVPDGTYPFYLVASTDEPVDIYYDSTTGAPLRQNETVTYQTGWYATEKPVSRINITRGPVYFLDGSVAVYPNAPQLFNTSSGPILVPPYEINFSISRAATVEVAVVALKPNMCTTTKENGTSYSQLTYNNKAGDVCKYLSTMTIPNTPNFDPNIVRRIYWDGTDENGKYVKSGNYEIRLTAKNYPDQGLYQPTIKQVTQSVDVLRLFDLPDAEAYAINKRDTDLNISYQLSVPMKVAIQIFKPGTTIYDYTKGTLRDPSTGREVKDINDVLVKSIVGIRPATTLIEELWDGTDYANQEVPDGTYPFRFVTALNSADIDSVTGEILGGNDSSTDSTKWSIAKVADAQQYVTLHHATVAIGDGQFVCEDWEKTVFFYPNPFKTATGTMEITKLPVPGTMSIKLYNLAGDLVREGGYTCVDAQNRMVDMGGSLYIQPDNNPVGSHIMTPAELAAHPSIRNAALRCFWDRTNDHGKKVARGVYFGLVDFRAQNGRQHCQKVVKILIPK